MPLASDEGRIPKQGVSEGVGELTRAGLRGSTVRHVLRGPGGAKRTASGANGNTFVEGLSPRSVHVNAGGIIHFEHASLALDFHIWVAAPLPQAMQLYPGVPVPRPLRNGPTYSTPETPHTRPSPKVSRGAAWYSPLTLYIYDLWVLGLSSSFAWHCPVSAVLEPFFAANVGAHHLDVGVGTGYYPAVAMTAGTLQSLTLIDLNENALQKAARRIGHPEATRCIVADALTPLPLVREDGQLERLDSISLMYLLHCLPGPVFRKAQIFSIMKMHLEDRGTLFGATILGKDVRHNWFGQALMWAYNRVGIFDNYEDGKKDFVTALHAEFEEVEAVVVGCVLIFKASRPIR
ncbi:hypothetical protein GJ744_005859 [Endocarpon pusillum]|uniref:Methyltransferase type 11 domain-containing protein n=1 Tax=Endocarpon pusillum TaxID=364733 RepID=A0A8H7DZE0_9EURO|nr:hypothetical protein GJ744_005859 [Endocarpon pusillum]